MIQGKTKVYGIIGNPVEHSMSPVMQNYYAEATDAKMVYVPFLTEEKGLEQAIKGAFSLHIQGLNITVPHKQAVIPYLDELDETAKAVGAVNTLVRTKSGFRGYNTDASGLLRAIREEKLVLNGTPSIILGAGGAAKAAAYLLAKEQAEVIYIMNRNVAKAESLCQEINDLFHSDVAKPLGLTDYSQLPRKKYLVIQATNVGMHSCQDAQDSREDLLIKDPLFYQLIENGFDVIYTPAETSFMKMVQQAGGKTYNGLTMLLYQGIEAFELWNPGVKLDQKTIETAKQLMLAQLGR